MNIPEDEILLFPNIFFSWESGQASIINEWANKTKKHIAIDTGILYLKYWKEKLKEKEKIPEKLNELINVQNKTIALYTVGETIDECVPQLIKDTKNTVFWLLRGHPAIAPKETLQNLLNLLGEYDGLNFECIESTTSHLYALLEKVDFHVTNSSSVLIEAINFSVPTVVISEAGIAHFRKNYKNDPFVIFESDIDNVVKILQIKPEKKLEKVTISSSLYIDDSIPEF